MPGDGSGVHLVMMCHSDNRRTEAAPHRGDASSPGRYSEVAHLQYVLAHLLPMCPVYTRSPTGEGKSAVYIQGSGEGVCKRPWPSQGVVTIEKSPSPAGRSPQRGRVGEGVSDIIDEPKFQFFNCLLPSPPTPLPERGDFVSNGLQSSPEICLFSDFILKNSVECSKVVQSSQRESWNFRGTNLY